MSIVRTNNLQNPDSSGINIELSQNGGVILSGVATATSGFSGDLTGNLTGNVTGNLTGTASTATAAATAYGLSGSPTLSGITSVSTSNLTVNGNAYPSAGPLSNRNLIINGAMQVAQRGTSSTSSGYHTVDRYKPSFGGVSVTQSQQALSSGDPYNEGFRHFLRTANTATSTSTTAYTQIEQRIESQNVATSGWNYTNSSSFLVSSFWVRSSLAGTYYVQYRAPDVGNYYFNRSFTLSADTWTKVTHTIPGDSSMVINNDNGIGLEVVVVAHYGTGWQGSTATDGSWFTRSNNEYFPSSTFSQNWANTASATFDITGVQIEVGSVATPFEHRSYGEELALCQRYFWIVPNARWLMGYKRHDSQVYFQLDTPVPMRTSPTPTITSVGTFTNHQTALGGAVQTTCSVFEYRPDSGRGSLRIDSTYTGTHVTIPSWEAGTIEFDAEL